MAYRRSLSIRSPLLVRRFNPSFSYLSHENDRSKQEDLQPSGSKIEAFLDQRRSFGNYVNTNSSRFSGAFHRTGSAFFGSGLCLNRYMSTSIGQDNNKISYASDAVDVITDAPMEAIASQAPALSEVAIAAADSAFLVAALQYLIDGVHTFTGLNWWASIALTTLLIRGATVPFLISQLKAKPKLSLMMTRFAEVKKQMQDTGMEPQAVAEGQKKMLGIFIEYGMTSFMGPLIQAPVFISFYYAIQNMAEKVPSFKTGGAFWFTDLAVPDAMYIFPVLLTMTMLAFMELNILTGNSVTGTMKKFVRGSALLTIPFTMNFPQAMFCNWITANMFSLCYGSVIRIPRVKKALGVQDIPIAPPPASQNVQSGLSFLQALKQASSMTNNNDNAPAIPAPVERSKSKGTKASSTAALKQRLRNLEKQVKQKKRMKKRK